MITSSLDFHGNRVTGATPAALEAYQQALAAVLGWRRGADRRLEQAIGDAPGFVMAHVMRAYLLLCSRDPQRVRSARTVLQAAAALPADEHEDGHRAVVAATLADDYGRARSLLGGLLERQPRDALALHVAHSFDYAVGDVVGMSQRVAAALPAWSRELPGCHAVLSMHAFGLVENGELHRAEQVARDALQLNPADARAHHVMAHVFETAERPDAGVHWLHEHLSHWSLDTSVATHGWWHLALFRLAQGEVDAALHLYDQRVRAGHTAEMADLIDAAALLWRVELRGGDAGRRWRELADAWAPHIDDAFCSFSDVHAMLAFVGARQWDRAQRLELALASAQLRPTRHGHTTSQLGLPACRALMAFGRGEHARAISLLGSLPAQVHRLGGSHAQRDVLHLTLLQAVERVRRPQRRVTRAPLAAAAQVGRQFGQLLAHGVAPPHAQGAT
jgi:hypothetical protein